MTEKQKPRSRAGRVIADLVADGLPVTVEAVRERAGVSNAGGALAARAWKCAADRGSAEVVGVPAVLASRSQQALDALWAQARALAAAEFESRRTALKKQLAAAEDQAAGVADQVEALAEQQERLETSAALGIAEITSSTTAKVRAKGEELVQARSRADRADGALEVLTTERDRLLAQLRELRGLLGTVIPAHQAQQGQYA